LTKLENRLYRLVHANHGITYAQAASALKAKIRSLKLAYNSLNDLGYVSCWYQKLYPNYRSIEVYEKGKDELYTELLLPHELTPKRISKFIQHVERDNRYCNTYLIDQDSAPLFIKTNHVEFDFDRYDYWLTYSLDNTNDINAH